jgi:outer membrane protein assembly factor BamA
MPGGVAARRSFAIALALLAVGQPAFGGSERAADAPVTADASSPGEWRAAGVPATTFSRDFGWGIGVHGGIYRFEPGYAPYRLGVTALVYGTTGGVQTHMLSIDAPPGLGRSLRLRVQGGYRRQLDAPFYGFGNDATVEADAPTGYYGYRSSAPFGLVSVQRGLAGELSAFAIYRLYLTQNEARPGSLLDELEPEGVEGGRHGSMTAGLLWDSRDHEPDPRRGLVLELSARLGNRFLGSEFRDGAVYAGASAYHPVGSRAVAAGRLGVDRQFGSPPFDRMKDFGGMFQTGGLGGGTTLRAAPQALYLGTTTLAANGEARLRFAEFDPRGVGVALAGVGFVDLGRVFDEPPSLPGFGLKGLHAGMGVGLRLVLQQVFVVRLDVNLVGGVGPRTYLDAGHAF